MGGYRLAVVHDSGNRVGRAGRLRRWFPEAGLVVFGHSHQPVNELGEGGQRLFNPGSPTQRRRAPVASYGWITIGAQGLQARIHPIDGPASYHHHPRGSPGRGAATIRPAAMRPRPKSRW